MISNEWMQSFPFSVDNHFVIWYRWMPRVNCRVHAVYLLSLCILFSEMFFSLARRPRLSPGCSVGWPQGCRPDTEWGNDSTWYHSCGATLANNLRSICTQGGESRHENGLNFLRHTRLLLCFVCFFFKITSEQVFMEGAVGKKAAIPAACFLYVRMRLR